MTRAMKKLLSLGLACSLLVSLAPIATAASVNTDSKKVSAVEYHYADVSDANTILATSGAGLLSSYEGTDRAAWEQLDGTRRAKLAKELERLPTSGFSGGDTRAIAAMRKQMKAFTGGGALFKPA